MPASATPGTALDELADRYWAWTCREFPITAFGAGEPLPDAVMFREGPDDFARRDTDAAALLTELGAIDVAALDTQGRITHRLLERELRDLRAAYALGAHQRPWLLPVGPEFNAVYFCNLVSVTSEDDAALHLARLATLPGFFADVAANLHAGRARGFRYPAVVLARAATNLEAMADAPLSTSPFVAPLRRSPLAARPAVQAAIAEAERLVAARIVPALRALAALMRGALGAASRSSIALTDDLLGAEAYRHWVRHFTTTDLEPEAIHALGWQEVERIEAEIAEVAADAGHRGADGRGDGSALRRAVEDDAALRAADADALRTALESLAKRIDRRIPQFFGHLPRITYGVESIPPELSPRMPPAYAQPNPADRRGSGVLWVNSDPSICRLHLLPALALHEAWPGHLMHLALMQEADTLPAFRRHHATKYSACLEGWALYCERLGEELGVYGTPAERLGRLDMELWRALRLVVDTGIHARGWSREQAIETMASRLSLPRPAIENEVDRYIALPGQALGYQIGARAFRGWRERAEQRLGARFVLRDFHDLLLGAGAVTLPVMDEIVDGWIAARA